VLLLIDWELDYGVIILKFCPSLEVLQFSGSVVIIHAVLVRHLLYSVFERHNLDTDYFMTITAEIHNTKIINQKILHKNKNIKEDDVTI